MTLLALGYSAPWRSSRVRGPEGFANCFVTQAALAALRNGSDSDRPLGKL
jgi:hypothetical protein